MEQPITTKNVGQPCVICGQAADAQATIVALQARVKELQCVADEKCRCFLERAEQAEQQLTQRTVERDTARRRVDELEAREVDVVMLREDLEQRTAELEHVRLLSSHNERRFELLEEKYKELRTLILALPKVEGEIMVSESLVLAEDPDMCSDMSDKEEAVAYAALLKHRQGMEG